MITVREAYCGRCGAIISDENSEIEYDLNEIVANDEKHAKLRGKLKLLNYDYERAKKDGVEVVLTDDEEKRHLKRICSRKGKVQKKTINRSDWSITLDMAVVTHDDLLEELEERLKEKGKSATKIGNKLRVTPYKPKREDDDIEHRVCCPVCNYILVRVVR